MTNKKYLFFIGLVMIIGITSLTANAKATNPEHFDLEYYPSTTTLSIYIIHGVTYPDEHYVNFIDIQVINPSDVVTQHFNVTFDHQDTYNINHYEYDNVTATEGADSSTGDKILVTATCNLGGIYSKYEYLHPTPPGHEFAFASVVPAFIIGAMIAGIFALLPIIIMKKNRKVQLAKIKEIRANKKKSKQ